MSGVDTVDMGFNVYFRFPVMLILYYSALKYAITGLLRFCYSLGIFSYTIILCGYISVTNVKNFFVAKPEFLHKILLAAI